jgi:hypothetical protein
MNTPTIQEALSDRWQKGHESVTIGADTIYTTIQDAVLNQTGAIIGRHGTIELTMVLLLTQNPNTIDWMKAATLQTNAGIFPMTEASIKQWFKEYVKATMSVDCMAAGWYTPLARAELTYLSQIAPKAKLVPLRSIEPYYCTPDHHWTTALAGHRVTVVSSFVESMKEQIEFKDAVWGDKHKTLLPSSTTWSFVRSYYSPALALGRCEWPAPIQSWSDAVEYLEKDVLDTQPRIVLLGCGGLAMPLAGRLKKKGIICVVMGGAIQLLFGIKGRRWEQHPQISQLFNDDWILPSPSEIPKGASQVEGGCYW